MKTIGNYHTVLNPIEYLFVESLLERNMEHFAQLKHEKIPVFVKAMLDAIELLGKGGKIGGALDAVLLQYKYVIRPEALTAAITMIVDDAEKTRKAFKENPGKAITEALLELFK